MRYTKQLIELQNIKSNNCKSTVVRFTTKAKATKKQDYHDF